MYDLIEHVISSKYADINGDGEDMYVEVELNFQLSFGFAIKATEWL